MHNYPKPITLGNPELQGMWNSPVVVQEKIDGSQFSFGIDENDQLICKSRASKINLAEPSNLFAPAVEKCKLLHEQRRLRVGYVYRAEAMASRRHNRIAYEQAPCGGMVLFDVEIHPNVFLPPTQLIFEAAYLDLQVVPHIATINSPPTKEQLEEWLQQKSILGGPIEGVVMKNYDVVDPRTGEVYMAKYVRPDFNEVKPKTKISSGLEGLDVFIDSYSTEARWHKAIQHLHEEGRLKFKPQDIPILIREIQADLLKEEADTIRKRLWELVWPKILRSATNGFGNFYKKWLFDQAYEVH